MSAPEMPTDAELSEWEARAKKRPLRTWEERLAGPAPFGCPNKLSLYSPPFAASVVRRLIAALRFAISRAEGAEAQRDAERAWRYALADYATALQFGTDAERLSASIECLKARIALIKAGGEP